MITLTGKQRAYLRSLAVDMDTIVQVGKGGIGENLIKTVGDALAARELIKLRVLPGSDMTAREAAETLAEKTDSTVITVIGTRFVLYRESQEHKKIFLD